MCDLFSDVLWLATATGCSFERAYNELIDCGGCTKAAYRQAKEGYAPTSLYCDEKIHHLKNLIDRY